ncbi:hypothetical protein G3M48_000432 [Beauveria asiatica]|uniref:Fatty acid hydroxylase domain-containing protein n=1 Tax=Beauveria asiatica TaxID=1069075 RepID=A0AAW0S1G0_9HYPO
MRAACGDRFDLYHWWVCQAYVLFSESTAHSGVRLLLNPPATLGWLWDRFDLALAVEDHGMHHRRGSKKIFDYGKQTRVWDCLFGTVYPREETPHVDRTKVAVNSITDRAKVHIKPPGIFDVPQSSAHYSSDGRTYLVATRQLCRHTHVRREERQIERRDSARTLFFLKNMPSLAMYSDTST